MDVEHRLVYAVSESVPTVGTVHCLLELQYASQLHQARGRGYALSCDLRGRMKCVLTREYEHAPASIEKVMPDIRRPERTPKPPSVDELAQQWSSQLRQEACACVEAELLAQAERGGLKPPELSLLNFKEEDLGRLAGFLVDSGMAGEEHALSQLKGSALTKPAKEFVAATEAQLQKRRRISGA